MDQQHSTTLTTDHKRGQHLKFEDRCTIKVLHQLGYSLRRIAASLNCSPSTVLNELQREAPVHVRVLMGVDLSILPKKVNSIMP